MKIAEITLVQNFSTISKKPEEYTIILKSKLGIRYYVFKGSEWASDTECFKCTELWCFVINRWIKSKISNDQLLDIFKIINSNYSDELMSVKKKKNKLFLISTEDIKK